VRVSVVNRLRRDAAAIALPRSTAARLTAARGAVDAAAAALPRYTADRIAAARSALDTPAGALGVLGPSATLERGYAIVRREPDASIVRDPAQAPAGAALRIRVA